MGKGISRGCGLVQDSFGKYYLGPKIKLTEMGMLNKPKYPNRKMSSIERSKILSVYFLLTHLQQCRARDDLQPW